jgi:hypothetical protein
MIAGLGTSDSENKPHKKVKLDNSDEDSRILIV